MVLTMDYAGNVGSAYRFAGTGDHRYERHTADGRLTESRVVNRNAV